MGYSFLFAFVFAALLVNGQLRYGLKAGLNISDVVINNIIDPDAESDFRIKSGVHAGGFIYADVNDRTALGAEILYSGKGVNAISNINLHYINVPLLLQYRLNDRFIAEGGPEVGYLFAANSTHGNVSDVWNNRLDLGLDIGLQYELSAKFMVGMRFNAGISSIVRDLNSPAGEKVRYQNRVLQFSLGYLLKELQ